MLRKNPAERHEHPWAARAFGWALRAYPSAFRREFGAQMQAAFAELLERRIVADPPGTPRRRRAGHGAQTRRLALAACTDAVLSAAAMRWADLRLRLLGPGRGLDAPRAADRSLLARAAGGLDRLWFDIRGSIRALARAPTYSMAAVLTLALGIGANTAIFSLVHGILLRPLPFSDGERLVLLQQTSQGLGGANIGFSVTELEAYRQAPGIEALVEYHNMQFILLGGAQPEQVSTGIVSWQFFDFLGVGPLHGRLLGPEDERVDADPILVLSHDYWVRSHGADPGVIGRKFVLNDRPHTIVGVLPPVPQYPRRHDIYMPVTACPVRSDPSFIKDPARRMMGLVARVDTVADRSSLADEIALIGTRMEAEHEAAFPAALALDRSVVGLQDELTRQARPRLLVLLLATLLVLVSACANVASLGLARGLRHQREIALRAALGAGKGRLMRLRVVETLLLSAVGGAFGVGIAAWGRGPLVEFAARYTTRAAEVTLDGRVLAFAITVSVLTGLVAGVAPAMPARRGLFRALRSGSAGVTAGTRTQRLRRWLIAAEVAASVVLLVAAGLTLRSVANLSRVDPGLELSNVLVTSMHFNPADYPQREQSNGFLRDLQQRLAEVPGIAAVAVANSVPLAGRPPIAEAELDTADAVDRIHVGVHGISADYFEVTGTRRLGGRFPTAEEIAAAAPVAVVSETMARQYWPDADPVGSLLHFVAEQLVVEVIGIAGNVRSQGLAAEAGPEIYVPLEVAGFASELLVRFEGDPMAVGEAILHAVRLLDPDMAMTGPYRLDQARSDAIASPRLIAMLLSLFAAVALLVAVTGIAGLIGYVVSDRTREIGLRMALGAAPGSLARLLLKQGLTPVLWGLGAGGLGAVALMRPLGELLFEVGQDDPATYLLVTLVVLAAAAAACLGPARRALSISPLEALRAE